MARRINSARDGRTVRSHSLRRQLSGVIHSRPGRGQGQIATRYQPLSETAPTPAGKADRSPLSAVEKFVVLVVAVGTGVIVATPVYGEPELWDLMLR